MGVIIETIGGAIQGTIGGLGIWAVICAVVVAIGLFARIEARASGTRRKNR